MGRYSAGERVKRYQNADVPAEYDLEYDEYPDDHYMANTVEETLPMLMIGNPKLPLRCRFEALGCAQNSL